MMTENQYQWYRKAIHDREFRKYIENNDPNYLRFSFWHRTTKLNIELGELYKSYLYNLKR